MPTIPETLIHTRQSPAHPYARFRRLERVSPSLPAAPDVETVIRRSLDHLALPSATLAGRRIAVAAGSRGIASLKEVVRATCGWLRDRGAHPFVFPAMGSHGGSTARGQRAILESYGITEASIGSSVEPSMDVVRVGQTPGGMEVFVGRNAWASDGIVVINRVKPHTNFSGKVESGILKMIAVGLGKRKSAAEVHRAAVSRGMEQAIREASGFVLESGKVLFGVALVENEFHELCMAHALHARDLPAREEEILMQARQFVPRIPFASLQLLVVDEIGKNISGTGMDAKVIGRSRSVAGHDGVPKIDLIYVRDLTAPSEGNAVGVGYADLIHERVRQKADLQKTYLNARTSLNWNSVRLPMSLPSDREAMDFALGVAGGPLPAAQRWIWVHNTLELNRIAVSEMLAREAASLEGWKLAGEAFDLRFDDRGDLIPCFS